MAASTAITEAQAELIRRVRSRTCAQFTPTDRRVLRNRSLAPEDIPAKLRCAICSKLAVNPFRLPCCEQAICEDCQSTLPASCPVCEHSPLSAEDCKPHKSLRTTIKVFLRTEEKKRETNRPKDTPPVTPVDFQPAPVVTAPPPAPVSVPKPDGPAEELRAVIEPPLANSLQSGGETREDGKPLEAEEEQRDDQQVRT